MLAACAPLQPDDSVDLGPAVASFSIGGRLMLRQGERRDHLRFEWEHSPDSDELLFSSPLGQGVARLTRDAGGALLELADGKRQRAGNWRALTQELLGTGLPLDQLPEWLRGARPRMQGDVEGWRVQVVESVPYRQARLPRVIEITLGDVELRLIVDQRNEPDG